MKFAELDGIARSAARSSGSLRDDVRQEAWVKFLTYPPQSHPYAWRCANSARNDLWRRERRWWRLSDEGPQACHDQFIGKQRASRTHMSRDELRHRRAERGRRWYHANLQHARGLVRERVRRHRAA